MFTAAAAMKIWNAEARPIPIDAQRVALAAASEHTDRIVVNPGTDSIVLRRPVVWSIAQGADYRAPWESPEFVADTRDLLGDITNLIEIGVASGDPGSTGSGSDVTLVLSVAAGLAPEVVRAVIYSVHARVSGSELFMSRVDALTLTRI
jgi:hypothetical protein